ncbi:MAG: hypothetical protein H7Y43_09460 [Akkermansiaceae bacterium]|nr:hypothetical protein [Verrucomicrobiales bacterium]
MAVLGHSDSRQNEGSADFSRLRLRKLLRPERLSPPKAEFFDFENMLQIQSNFMGTAASHQKVICFSGESPVKPFVSSRSVVVLVKCYGLGAFREIFETAFYSDNSDNSAENVAHE